MRTHSGFSLSTCLVLALAGLVSPVQAQSTHHRVLISARDESRGLPLIVPTVTPPPQLVPLQANLTQAYPVIGANADGSDVWPCFGRGANEDCATVGNPAVPLPTGSIVMGRPAYTFALQNDNIIGYGLGNGVGCDAFTNGTVGQPYEPGVVYRPCAQIFTTFEDDTGDSNDDLLQRVIVKQGNNIIYDSGTVDFGPAGPIKYPVDVVLYSDANFGYWPGALYGPNNGNCAGSTGYPLSAATFPGFYVVESNSTCQRPVPGPATFVSITRLATPTYHPVSGTACTTKGVASPCYTTTWSTQYEIHQNFSLFLE